MVVEGSSEDLEEQTALIEPAAESYLDSLELALQMAEEIAPRDQVGCTDFRAVVLRLAESVELAAVRGQCDCQGSGCYYCYHLRALVPSFELRLQSIQTGRTGGVGLFCRLGR